MKVKKTRQVTFATMMQTDGTTSVFGVFRGTLRNAHLRKERQYINLHEAEQVGSVAHNRQGGRFDYYATAKAHETPGFPAFDWSVEPPWVVSVPAPRRLRPGDSWIVQGQGDMRKAVLTRFPRAD